QRIALAAEDDDMGARPVRVRLLVGADGKLRDVRIERAAGEIEAPTAAAGAAHLRGRQRQVDGVGMDGEAYILDLASFDPFGKYWPPRDGPEAKRLRLPHKPR